ncbi:hypothetical protein DTO027I6_286 [Penicillium roqueforti]|uniref:uncharacterized protein n=1 Tax=Penicillium roqueforti TaxID=5082 RepID=UPI00190DA212|nr:uncharacterized protein LCP9604111_3605 [Penicillium roqueforti]KAF9250089.1 hypothetical protein LCP9604111_3605 [Penicillium roqueforti]KAI2679540.1 hypothetical protein CBS147355_4022 [Penicillium roqueforti]KAI2717044.1 hypothetical protein CBS147318_5171 [Penicillium roqueforti]KAI2730536.1 hypothetical protein CBS147332_2388 [Penicillium roqueforti]KAI3109905.1 hypothetical protein CBS147331_5334 [Penicillium roqueforti]
MGNDAGDAISEIHCCLSHAGTDIGSSTAAFRLHRGHAWRENTRVYLGNWVSITIAMIQLALSTSAINKDISELA